MAALTVEALTVYDHLDPPPVAKGKTVELTVAWYLKDYKVISITNTTYLKPGMWLTPRALEQANQWDGWQVTVVDNEVLSNITSAIIGRVAGQ